MKVVYGRRRSFVNRFYNFRVDMYDFDDEVEDEGIDKVNVNMIIMAVVKNEGNLFSLIKVQ